MKLKRFNAPDIRQAISKVREELGSDAVILSNKKTQTGVEIIAAVDYDDAILSESTIDAVALPEENMKNREENHKNLAGLMDDMSSMMKPQADEDAPFWKRVMAESYDKNTEKKSTSIKPSKDTFQDVINSAGNKSDKKDWSPQLVSDDEEEIESFIPSYTRDGKLASLDNQHRVDNQESQLAEFAKKIPREDLNKNTPEDGKSLTNVWKELNDLRGLLEHQMSSLAWGDMGKRTPQKAKVLRKLMELGVSPVISRRILQEVKEEEQFDVVWKRALTVLATRLKVMDDVVLKHAGVFALVGPTGVGKTTTLAKMAARYALSYGADDIALVTTDNYRIGAHEQLRTYGRILGVPVRIANDAAELKNVLKSLYDKKLILIDTAGTSQRDLRLSEQFAMLSEGSPLIKTFLVLSAASQINVMDEIVRAYQKVVLDGCVVTKLDESSLLGGALSIIYHYKLPLAYLSDGQRVPEDLHTTRPVDLIKRTVQMMHKGNYRIDDEVIEMAFGGSDDGFC